MLIGASSALARWRCGEAGCSRRQRRDHAGGGRAQLGLARIGVGLLRQQLPVARQQLELVARARGHAGQEDLPHAAFAAQPHRMAAAVPVIEVADHADAHRVGRPHREAAAGHAIASRAGRRAEDLEGAQVRAFAQQPGVHLAQHRAEAIGVVEQRALAVGPLHLQPVGRRGRAAGLRTGRRRHAAAAGPAARRRRATTACTCAAPGRNAASQRAAIGQRVRTEHAEGVGMPALAQRLHVLCGQAWAASSRAVPARLNLNVPDLAGVLADRAVGREHAHAGDVQRWPSAPRPAGRGTARRRVPAPRRRRRSRPAAGSGRRPTAAHRPRRGSAPARPARRRRRRWPAAPPAGAGAGRGCAAAGSRLRAAPRPRARGGRR